MTLGNGFVDFGGSALVLWLPGIFVLALWLLQDRGRVTQPPEPPSTYAPLLANLGAVLVGIGWLGWELSQPFHMLPATLDWHRVALNTLLGMAGATLAAQLYAWLATGHPESLLASQGQVAGWGAVLASAPFVPSWAALALGTLAGFAFPLVRYAIEAWLHLRDAAGTIALALTSGPLGLLGVALFADGQAGQGWNGYPASSPLPGVAGLFVSGNTAQLSAQAIGLFAFTLWAAFWGLLLGAASRLSTHKPTAPMLHTPATAAAAQPPLERTENAARTPLKRGHWTGHHLLPHQHKGPSRFTRPHLHRQNSGGRQLYEDHRRQSQGPAALFRTWTGHPSHDQPSQSCALQHPGDRHPPRSGPGDLR